MIASNFRRGAMALLLLVSAACEISTGPDDGTAPRSGFSLLIERRSAAGQRSFYTMSPDGKVFTPFTNVPTDARVLIPSPDGRTIAYLREIDGLVELWAMDRDGANRRAILSGGSYVIESAAWSPDGERLAIAYSTATITNDIATVNADGTGLIDLTPDPLPGVWIDRSPAWSPDGARLAFSSNRSGTTRLWIMDADGANARQVLPQSFPSNEQKPVWAPDTTGFLAVVATTAEGPGIAFVREDGTDFRHVPIPGGPTDPVWLPDGRLVYVADESGDFDLWTVDRVSSATTQVTMRRDDDLRPSVLKDVAPFAWLGFAAPATYQINRPFAVDMTTADVLTDGRADLLILSPIFNEIRIMKGGANGTLQSVGALFVESDVSALRTGLITLDNAPDVIGRGDSAAYLWRGRVDGPSIATRIPVAGILRDVAVADLDLNGRADIISLVETTEGQPFRLKSHTIGTSDNVAPGVDQLTDRSNGRSLCAGDMTGDGRPDIAVFAGSATLGAYLAEGKGELGLEPLALAGSGLSSDVDAIPYCADFNNDGKDDVALFSPGAPQSVSIHRFGATSFGAPARISAAADAVAIVDIDRDGDLDLVMASSGTAAILVARNRGGGTFDTPVSYSIANAPIAIAAADINGDAWPDVMAVENTGELVVLLSRGRN
jgi:hypothetical protein